MPLQYIDSNDTVYVSEEGEHNVSIFTAEGEYITTFGEEGSAYGQFKYPCGLQIDKNDFLLVCDRSNDRIQIF